MPRTSCHAGCSECSCSKPYPADLAEICRERREEGPTPCWWPQCDCDGKPPEPFETFWHKPSSPFWAYVRTVGSWIAFVVSFCWFWSRVH